MFKVTALVLVVALAGCASSERSQDTASFGGEAGVEEKLAAPEAPPPPGVGGQNATPVPAAARMVIRTATLSLVVENAAATLKRAVAIVESQGGYVAETHEWQDFGQTRASATLRIPAEKLNAALEDIRKDAIRVQSDAITGRDVSEEYADLGAQLTNLRATETELRQLLTTVRERTQKASEVLEVYNELSRVRGEIERLQGRMDYLKQMTAMSTIVLDLIPDKLSQPIVEPGWRPMAIAKTAARTLVESLKVIGSALIYLIVLFLPLAIVFGIVLFIAFRLWRFVRPKKRMPPPLAGAGGSGPAAGV